MRKQVVKDENCSENLKLTCNILKTGLKSLDKRKDRISMEKKGQRSLPSNRKDTRNRSRKYLNTRGLNVFEELFICLSSIKIYPFDFRHCPHCPSVLNFLNPIPRKLHIQLHFHQVEGIGYISFSVKNPIF
jgi:hypothetical protein